MNYEAIMAGFPDLFDAAILAQNYLDDRYNMAPPKSQLIFDVKDIVTKDEKISSLGGYTKLDETAESGTWAQKGLVEGYDKTITPIQYTGKLSISRIMRMNDPKGAFADFNLQTRYHTTAAIYTHETLAASFLNGAFATTTTPDACYLCAANHPQSPAVTGTTYSNVLSTTLKGDGAALKAAWTHAADNLFNMAGQPIEITSWLLVVPPALKDVAYREVKAIYGNATTVVPTTVQTGDLYGQEINVVDWTWLSTKMGGSDTAWFLIANPTAYAGTHSLRFVWRERPTFNAEGAQAYVNPENGSFNWPVVMQCACGAIDWRHIIGSSGTGN